MHSVNVGGDSSNCNAIYSNLILSNEDTTIQVLWICRRDAGQM